MWIWEAVKIGRPKLAEAPRSPFFEVDEFEPALINIGLRFADIFAPLNDIRKAHSLEKSERDALAEALLQIIAWQDIRHGLDMRELSLHTLADELCAGLWGAAVKRGFVKLEKEEQREILHLLYEHTLGDRFVLSRALGLFFPGWRIWYMERTGELNLALPQPENETNASKLEMLLDLFAPIEQEYRVYWQKTPCILDSPCGMLNFCVFSQ